MGEAGVILIGLIGLIICAVGAGVTVWLILRTWKRRREMALVTKLIVSIVAAAAAFGAVGTLSGIVKAFVAVGGESADPSQKARILAEGISEAMNCMAFALVIWVPSVIVTLILFRTSKKKS